MMERVQENRVVIDAEKGENSMEERKIPPKD